MLDEVVTIHEAAALTGLTIHGILWRLNKGHYTARKSGKTWLILKSSL